MCSIQVKIDLYYLLIYYIIYGLILYFMTIITPLFSIFVVSLSLEERSSESIGEEYLSWKRTRQQINGGEGRF